MKTRNLTGRQRCETCDNGAWVTVGIQARPFGEEMGPCPSCELGFRLETGETGKARWPEGFWASRTSPVELETLGPGAALPKAEGQAKLRELMGRMALSDGVRP